MATFPGLPTGRSAARVLMAFLPTSATKAPAASGLLRGESPVLLWFLPGVAISVLIALAAGGRVGRALGTRRAVAMALIVSLGIIVSATLTPLRGAFDVGGVGTGSCDFSRIGLPPLRELLRLNDTSLNILLFVPLGFSLAFLPRTRRTALMIAGAIALPFVIELAQLLVPLLDRGCQSADVVDNLAGLTIGLGGGIVVGRIAGAIGRR